MAGQQGTTSRLVECWDHVEANIRTLETARNSQDAEIRTEYNSLIEKGTCFVAYSSGSKYTFAPSKFIGYVDNNFATHQRYRNNRDPRNRRQGGDTNNAIAKILGRDPERNDAAEDLYRGFCRELGFEPRPSGTGGHPRKYWMTDIVIQNSAIQEICLSDWIPPPEITSTITRKIRDTSTTRRLKRLYDYQCMLCNTRLGRTGGPAYAEGAHVRPLGRPHEGPDEPENIVVLCPNHHVMLDAGLLGIDPDTFEVRLAPGAEPVDYNGRRLQLRGGHTLRREHLEYHRREIFNRQ